MDAAGSSMAAPPPSSAPPLRVAVCLLGLERSLDLILNNSALLLRHLRQLGALDVFGVQPAEPFAWRVVPALLRLAGLEGHATFETQRVPNASAPPRYYPQRFGHGFMVTLHDCAHCAAMIGAREASERWRYDVIARLRLDLFWETLPPLPPSFLPHDVYVPGMSNCGGVDDKFAIGGREGMEAYLTRVARLDYSRNRSSFNSEMFLGQALRHAARVHSAHSWMFCKFGRANEMANWSRTSSNMWLECSLRIVRRLRCERITCAWCGQGCRCWNNVCPTQDAVLHGKRMCHEWRSSPLFANRTNRNHEPVLPGVALEPNAQLLL